MCRVQETARGRPRRVQPPVVGWSIDRSTTSALVTSALGMAISNRQPDPETVIHSDQGTPFTSWAFTDRANQSGLVPSIGVRRGLFRLTP